MILDHFYIQELTEFQVLRRNQTKGFPRESRDKQRDLHYMDDGSISPPRMCGDKNIEITAPSIKAGSPLHTQG